MYQIYFADKFRATIVCVAGARRSYCFLLCDAPVLAQLPFYGEAVDVEVSKPSSTWDTQLVCIYTSAQSASEKSQVRYFAIADA